MFNIIVEINCIKNNLISHKIHAQNLNALCVFIVLYKYYKFEMDE